MSCGVIFNAIYKAPLGFYIIRALSEKRINFLGHEVACYYKSLNEFPADDVTLIKFIDSLKIADHRDSTLSVLEMVDSNESSLKFAFVLKPFTQITRSDTSEFFIDSIRVDEYKGIISYSDSLLVRNVDTLLEQTVLTSVRATAFMREDSLVYDNKAAKIFSHISYGKIWVAKSCGK